MSQSISQRIFWLNKIVNKSAMRDRRYSRLDGSNRFLWIIQRTIYRWLRGRLSSPLAPSRGLSRQGNPFRRETRYAIRFRKNCVRHLRHSDAGVMRRWKFLIRESIRLSFTTYVNEEKKCESAWHQNRPFFHCYVLLSGGNKICNFIAIAKYDSCRCINVTYSSAFIVKVNW